jgi:hypothetical protein
MAGLDPHRAAVADPDPDRVDIDDGIRPSSSGRTDQSCISSRTLSVIREIVSRLTEAR